MRHSSLSLHSQANKSQGWGLCPPLCPLRASQRAYIQKNFAIFVFNTFKALKWITHIGTLCVYVCGHIPSISLEKIPLKTSMVYLYSLGKGPCLCVKLKVHSFVSVASALPVAAGRFSWLALCVLQVTSDIWSLYSETVLSQLITSALEWILLFCPVHAPRGSSNFRIVKFY